MLVSDLEDVTSGPLKIAIIKLIWRVVGGVSTYIHVHVAASCEKEEYQQPLQPCRTSDREEHGNRRSGYPRAKRTGVSSACWKSSGA